MKKFISLFLVFSLVFSCFASNTFAKLNNNSENIILNLKLDLDDSLIDINKNIENNKQTLEKLNIDLKNQKSINATRNDKNNKLHLNLKLTQQDEEVNLFGVMGHSSLKMNGKEIPMIAEGMLTAEQIDNKTVYQGLLYLDLEIGDTTVPGAMQLWYSENGQDAYATISAGSLDSENGVAFLKFGVPFKEQKIIIQNNRENDEGKENSSYLEKDFVKSVKSVPEESQTANSTWKKFKYEGSGYSYTYSSSLKSGTASEPVAIVDVFAREPRDLGESNGEVDVRVLPNVDGVNKSFSGDYRFLGASVSSATVNWGWTERDVASITNAYPLTSNNGSLISTAWNIVNAYTDLNPLWDIAISYVLGNTNSSWEISDNGDIFVNRGTKTFYNLSSVKSLPSNAPYYDSELHDGGVFAAFFIQSRGNNIWSSKAEAEIVYNVHWLEYTNTFPLRTGKVVVNHFIAGY
ncbi:hypothetical protein NSQ43_05080 [Sporosarcina sp. FSL W8-0480]|uniref:hypothetical protein n=1 Tax=Sporosarcina sp. FSL W8-0480 TaxID=2954701 RepID=UPI0030DD31E0